MGKENSFGEMFAGILGGMLMHELQAISKVSGVFKSLESYDIVLFDFSDWDCDGLNEKTTSFVLGIPPGTLRVKAGNRGGDVQTGTISARLFDADSGQVVVTIHDWCVAQAKRSGRGYSNTQRYFRFESGSYTGSSSSVSGGCVVM